MPVPGVWVGPVEGFGEGLVPPPEGEADGPGDCLPVPPLPSGEAPGDGDVPPSPVPWLPSCEWPGPWLPLGLRVLLLLLLLRLEETADRRAVAAVHAGAGDQLDRGHRAHRQDEHRAGRQQRALPAAQPCAVRRAPRVLLGEAGVAGAAVALAVEVRVPVCAGVRPGVRLGRRDAAIRVKCLRHQLRAVVVRRRQRRGRVLGARGALHGPARVAHRNPAQPGLRGDGRLAQLLARAPEQVLENGAAGGGHHADDTGADDRAVYTEFAREQRGDHRRQCTAGHLRDAQLQALALGLCLAFGFVVHLLPLLVLSVPLVARRDIRD
ncbi:hypothetical protein GCM10020000_20120 [Streptomyces olivoverticillatus]